MESASTLVKCGFVQILCAISLLLFKILGNSVTYNYKETLHQHFQSRAKVIPLVHVDVASIVLYAITGVLLLCLSSRTKNLCLILSVNISTLLSLFGASGLREAPAKKKHVNLGITQKGGGSKRLPKLFVAVLQ